MEVKMHIPSIGRTKDKIEMYLVRYTVLAINIAHLYFLKKLKKYFMKIKVILKI